MQFVLNDQVWRPQRGVFDRLGRRQAAARLGVELRVLDFRAAEAVPLAVAVHHAEEHLHFALPRHLGKLVHRGDQQRRQAAR